MGSLIAKEIAKEKDFFISYTSKDEKWATWIAETLENNGHTTIIQAWDFKSSGRSLSDALENLESNRVTARTVLPTSPVTVEYSLTEKGCDFEHVFMK